MSENIVNCSLPVAPQPAIYWTDVKILEFDGKCAPEGRRRLLRATIYSANGDPDGGYRWIVECVGNVRPIQEGCEQSLELAKAKATQYMVYQYEGPYYSKD